MANVVCFVCGSLGGEYTVHIRKRDQNQSFFPFLEHHDPPYGATPPTGPEAAVASCRLCYSFLNQQWECFERSKTPIVKRLYWLKRADEGQYTGAEMNTQGEYAALLFGLQHHRAPYNPYNESQSNQVTGMMTYKTESLDGEDAIHQRKKTKEKDVLDLTLSQNNAADHEESRKEAELHTTMVCYTCGGTESSTNAKFVYSRRQTDAVKFFPFLERVKPPKGAMPLSRSGLTKVCARCWDSLQQQWKSYELSNTAEDERTYQIQNSGEKTEACYICGQLHVRTGLAQLFAKEKSVGVMYFPFIYSLKRPEWARPVDAEGSVLACASCHGVLEHQWQAYEKEQVPMANRTYRLLPQENTTHEKPEILAQPLNIHISQNTSSPASSVTNGGTDGLLAIASQSVKTEDGRSETCYVCGFKMQHNKSHVLSAYPPKNKWEKDRMLPFFPFLANREPKSEAQPMTSTGQCLACRYCYHSLVDQWYQFERSDKDTNRWFRTYNTHEYVCFVCAQTTKRKHIKAINLEKYPELSCKPVPPGVLIMDDGQNSVVCVPCLKKLRTDGESSTGNNSKDQLILPPKMRKDKYLEDQRNPTIENDESQPMVPESSPVNQLRMSASVDNVYIKQEPPAGELSPRDGLPGPSGASPIKQAPLSPVSPVTSRPSVPSLVSPSHSLSQAGQAMNATRTSSFAAALRKLANQAKEPGDSPRSRDSNSNLHSAHVQSAQSHESPTSGNPSPRSVTPKRGPPPLVGLSPQVPSSPAHQAPASSHHQSVIQPGVSHQSVIQPSVSHPSVMQPGTSHQVMQPAGPSSVTPGHSTVSQSGRASAHASSERRPSYPERPVSHGRASVSSVPESERPKERSHHERRDSDADRNRIGTPNKHRSTPQAREESRGFQPYRPPTSTGTDDVSALRVPLPPRFPTGLDPATAAAAAAYPYHPAFMAHAFHHPAFRLDDPLMLDRYRMLQPGFLPYPGLIPHPGLAHPAMLSAGRYPAELLAGQIPLVSPSGRILDPKSPSVSSERLKAEERERERELEKERERERERAREKDKREQELMRERRRSPHRDRHHNQHNGLSYASSSTRPSHEPSSSRHQPLIATAHSRPAPSTRPDQLQAAHQKSPASSSTRDLARGDPSRDLIRDKRELYGRDYERRLQEEQAKQLQQKPGSAQRKEECVPLSLISSKHRDMDASHRPKPHVSGLNNFTDYERHFMAEKLFSKHDNKNKEQSQPKEHKFFDLNHLPAHARDFPFQSSKNRELGVEDSVDDLSWLTRTEKPVSRLDRQEERVALLRAGEEVDENDELDNQLQLDHEQLVRWQKLSVVKVGRDAPFDRSRRKRQFLSSCGLTTHRKKRDLQYVKLCKKRSVYREQTASPTLLTDQASAILDAEDRDPASLFRIHRAQTQEEHVRKSDLKRKVRFLDMLGLSVLTSEKRKEKEKLDQICAIYRRRREGSASDADSPRKEAVSGVVPITSPAKRKTSEPGRSLDREKASREFAQEFHDSVLKTTRQQEASRSLAHKKPRLDDSLNSPPNHSKSPSSRVHQSRDHVSASRDAPRDHPRDVPRDLSMTKAQLPPALRVDNLCQSSAGTQASPVAHPSHTSNAGSAHVHAHAHKWPGIATIIDSYTRYDHELCLERRVLEHQTLQLKSRNQDLNRSAEQLSSRMAELIARKQHQQQQRLHTQNALDNLKKTLKLRR